MLVEPDRRQRRRLRKTGGKPIFCDKRSPPKHIAAVEAQAGAPVLLGRYLPAGNQGNPPPFLPALQLTADKSVTFYTRDLGDITVKGRKARLILTESGRKAHQKTQVLRRFTFIRRKKLSVRRWYSKECLQKIVRRHHARGV